MSEYVPGPQPAAGFVMRARVVRWIDADTVLTQPLPYRRDVQLRVRLRDAWEPEIGTAGELDRRAIAEATFPIGSVVVLTNSRHYWPYERLEARVDKDLTIH